MNYIFNMNIIYQIDKVTMLHIMNNINTTNNDIINNMNNTTNDINEIVIIDIIQNNDNIKNMK